MKNIYLLILAVLLNISCNKKNNNLTIDLKVSGPQIDFALTELNQAFENQIEGKTMSSTKVVFLNAEDVKSIPKELKIPQEMHEEAFSIRKTMHDGQRTFYVIGGGVAGAMYGGLELAEQINIGDLDSVEEMDKSPHMNMRGIKFNIPLDVRTPSYTNMSDVGQQNIAEMWNFDFWKETIDNLALHRYNFISLWSLHPFPSMVKVPDYPDIALDDVQRSTGKFEEIYSSLGNDYDDPELINNVEILKKISIDEKIVFWKKVMRYAKDRNVDMYVVTWNIFDYGTKNQYGITVEFDNPVTIDYFRKSVKEMFVIYPDLAGMGFTPGENMRTLTTAEKEQWVFDTYGKGMLDAAEEMPGRKMTMLHRQHDTETKKVAEQFQPIVDNPDINFLFSFKYAKAHVHSYTKQPYHQEFVEDITQGGLKTIWTLRNDDTFYYRWGAPDFVREFIHNIPVDVSEGWYLGSDQWIWGREFLSKNPKPTREIELSKHWYQWMLWGRLGYDPTVTNERFQKILQTKYPEVDAKKLFVAWQEASMIYPKTTGFHWGMFDFQWYIEGAQGRPSFAENESGFHDVNRFITLPPLASTPYVSIPSYVEKYPNTKEIDSITPLQLANQIHSHVDKSRKIISYLPIVGNDDLVRTIKDITIISALGKYYAYKIEGATYLALYRKTNNKKDQDKSIERLNKAAEQWRLYVSLALTAYKNPIWTNRVGYVDWRKFMTEVLKDIEIAGGVPELASMIDSPGGTIITSNVLDGQISWTYNTQEAGNYYAEIKYALEKGIYNAELTVNNMPSQSFDFWPSGGNETYAWDKVRIRLEKGSNEIKLSMPEGANLKIKHLNIIKNN